MASKSPVSSISSIRAVEGRVGITAARMATGMHASPGRAVFASPHIRAQATKIAIKPGVRSSMVSFLGSGRYWGVRGTIAAGSRVRVSICSFLSLRGKARETPEGSGQRNPLELL